MLDINLIRQQPEEFIAMLHKRQLASEEPKINELFRLINIARNLYSALMTRKPCVTRSQKRLRK